MVARQRRRGFPRRSSQGSNLMLRFTPVRNPAPAPIPDFGPKVRPCVRSCDCKYANTPRPIYTLTKIYAACHPGTVPRYHSVSFPASPSSHRSDSCVRPLQQALRLYLRTKSCNNKSWNTLPVYHHGRDPHLPSTVPLPRRPPAFLRIQCRLPQVLYLFSGPVALQGLLPELFESFAVPRIPGIISKSICSPRRCASKTYEATQVAVPPQFQGAAC
jgi:hypothetical protein